MVVLVIPALRSLRQEDYLRSKASLDHSLKSYK